MLIFCNCSASLQQVIELPEEDTGEIVSHFIPCDNDDTVGKAGIGPQSLLKVVVEGEEDGFEEDPSWAD